MMATRHVRSAAGYTSAILAVAAMGATGAFARGAPPTTPPGITLIEVVRELGNSQPQVLWLRPGDSDGRSLLISEKDEAGVSRCLDQCAAEFPPLLAPRGAKATGDWTLVRRQDGTRQWAYQSHPLYTWTREQEPGEVATNVGLAETANLKLAEGSQKPSEVGVPPEGWQVARFLPAASLMLPDGIDARVVYSAQAVTLTNAAGRTLYGFDGDARNDNQVCNASGCEIQWKPLLAPALASSMGDFSIVSRTDGASQWAYKKKPLYTYVQDKLPGDVHGAGVSEKWHVVVLTENFRPANVGIVGLEGYGDTFAVKGMTLYGGYAFGKRWGGRNLRDTFKDAYHKGKTLGGAACVDAECLARWKPLVADAKAKSNGFWEPIERADGTRQWAYKGFAMYTYVGDKVSGDHNGQATYDFAKREGSPEYMKRVAFYHEVGKSSGGAGIYWNIAKP